MKFESWVIIILYGMWVITLAGAYYIAQKYTPKVHLTWTTPEVKPLNGAQIEHITIHNDKLIIITQDGRAHKIKIPTQIELSALPDILSILLYLSGTLGLVIIVIIISEIEGVYQTQTP